MRISLENTTYIYNKKSKRFAFVAIHEVNHAFLEKKITGIIGGAGSGKSTLIQLCNALLIPSFGQVNLIATKKHEKNFLINAKTKKIKKIKEIRKNIGMVFQFAEAQLFCETVEKDIMFGPLNNNKSEQEAKDLAKKYIEIVGLDQSYLKKSPFELSGGQKRRVAIAGILALESEILILDEPTAGLDPQGEIEFNNLFKELNKKYEKTIIIVTHNMDHVLEICDEVVVLKDGEVSCKAKPYQVFSNAKLIEDNNLSLPKVFNVVHQLQKKGIYLEVSNLRTIDDLVDLIVDYDSQDNKVDKQDSLKTIDDEYKKIESRNQEKLTTKFILNKKPSISKLFKPKDKKTNGN